MPTLLCFGLGYCAAHYIAEFGHRFDRIIGTVRTRVKARSLAATGIGGHAVEALEFDGKCAPAALGEAIAASEVALVSVPPSEQGDPVLALFAGALAAAPLSSIVYLSTIGVYGDHNGAWVDESTPPGPLSARSRERLAAEQKWQQLGARSRKSVAILRLSGIYGPGRNVLRNLVRGAARRVDKKGQVFNRVHVADIAQAIDAAIELRASGLFNVTDDAPTPAADPIVLAAALLGVPPPPEIPFEAAAATMSPMALSFWGEVKRVRNDKMKAELGVRLRYPTYREGLRALHAAGDHAVVGR